MPARHRPLDTPAAPLSREQQWVALKPKVHAAARSLTTNGERREELESAGRVGAWEAVCTWKPERGPLEAWAQLHIKSAMLRTLRGETTLLSRHDFEAIPKVRHAIGEGFTEPAAIAAATGASVAQVQRILLSPRKTSLDEALQVNGTDTHPESPAATLTLGPATVRPRDAWVAVRVTGSDGAPPETMSELGRQLGESKQNIRRRVQRAARRSLTPLD